MSNNTNAFRAKKLLLTILGTLLFLFAPSLSAYNNAWSDNEDYVVPSQTNVTPGEGNNSKEVKGAKDCPKKTASPVYAASGHFTWSARDIRLRGKPSLQLSRSYTSKDPISGLFGNGWISNLESGFIETIKYVNDDGSVETHYVYRREDGLRYTFKDINGTMENPSGMYHKVETISETSYKVTYPDHLVETYVDDALISKEDANGNKITYTYDENSLIKSIKNNNGNTLTFTFGGNGFVTAVTDNNSRVWKYAYDVNGSLTSVTDPLSGVRNYTYEKYQADNDAKAYFHLTKITDESGKVVTEVMYEKGFTGSYDYKNGRVKSYTDGENNYTYNWNYLNYSDPYITKTDSSGFWDRLYLSDSGHVTKYYDSTYKYTTYNVDENLTMTGLTDRNGNEWNQSVDDLGRVISSTSPLGFETTYKYNGNTRDISETTSPLGYVTKVGYDTNYNPITVTLADNSVYKASFDTKGNVIDTTDPSNVKNSISTYNANSQPLTVKNALGDTFTITYDSFGQAATSTDAEGNTVTYTYNQLGYLTKTVNALDSEIAYTYDASGRLLSITDPTKSNKTSYLYDAFGRVSKVTKADGRTLDYAYNTSNRIISIIDSAGRTTAFTYDNIGNMTKVAAGSSSIYYYYNSDGSMNRAYNGKNVYLTYNADGQLTREQQDGQNVDYTYDNDGKVKTTVTKDATITYGRNSLGDLTSIGDGVDTFDFAYDTNNLRSAITYPNDVDTAYTLNNAYQITALNNGLTSNSYTYDKNGMLTQKTVDLVSTNYTYDAAGRVTSAGANTYAYSNVGNMTNNSATYDTKTNQLNSTSTYTYEYDAFGNLTKKTKTDGTYKEYVWTDWDQLESVESFTSGAVSTKKISFTYGALGRRLSRTVDGTTEYYLYSGNNLISIMDSSSYRNLKYRITHDETIDSPLSIVDGSGNRYYYHRDYLGSVVGLTDSSGTSVESYSYDAYGVTTQDSLTVATGNPFAFTSRVMDDEDLYYYRSRYYDPTVGRFLSEDSLGFSSGDFNLYRYALNNPVNFVDPYGFKPGDKFDSPDAAVKDAFAYINPSSIADSREYGGWIHKDADGKYHYSEPTKGTKDGLANIPDAAATDVAWYHTHGSADPGYDNENFSGATGDKGYSDALNKVGWLATPAGAIKKYDPATHTVTNEGNVSKDPCKQKKR